MDFKKATDILFSQVAHADLARTLDVSVALIRQARLQPKAAAHRAPPEGWKRPFATSPKTARGTTSGLPIS